jgi:hypothetical protein
MPSIKSNLNFIDVIKAIKRIFAFSTSSVFYDLSRHILNLVYTVSAICGRILYPEFDLTV